MTKQSDDFIKLLLNDKKNKLKQLQEEYKISVAVYESKRELVMSDIDTLEKQINK